MRRAIDTIIAICILLGCGGLSSCVYEAGDLKQGGMDPEDIPHDDRVLLNFNIETSLLDQSNSVAEKISSLRIIVIGDGKVECNRLVQFGSNTTAAGFGYNFQWRTSPGIKSLFFIANEDHTGDMSYQAQKGTTIPSNLPTSLTTLLDGYSPAANTNGRELADVLTSAYFQPDYNKTDGSVYIPYSSFYGNIHAEEQQVVPLDIYLVPVATKFTFRFINRRKSQVQIDNITVSQTNRTNWLLAQVYGNDVEKSFGDRKYYWVDWLAKVAEESNKYPGFYDNMDFNDKYGWISNYTMPVTEDDTYDNIFIDEATKFTIPAAIWENPEKFNPDTDESQVVMRGPFYAPESWNTYVYYDAATEQWITTQRYALTIGIRDLSASSAKDPVFEDVTIGNLKSLFRDTSVLITLTMSEGKLEIYAEKTDWNHRYAQGWVVEGRP